MRVEVLKYSFSYQPPKKIPTFSREDDDRGFLYPSWCFSSITGGGGGTRTKTKTSSNLAMWETEVKDLAVKYMEELKWVAFFPGVHKSKEEKIDSY